MLNGHENKTKQNRIRQMRNIWKRGLQIVVGRLVHLNKDLKEVRGLAKKLCKREVF